jgi:hypothetical protein
MIKEGRISVAGEVFIVDRTNPAEFLSGGISAGRVEDVARLKIYTESQIIRKGTETPNMARINGDWIEATIILSDYTEELMSIISNNRSSGHDFDGGSYKEGHILPSSRYSALIIRDSRSPADKPALYIPFAFCPGPVDFFSYGDGSAMTEFAQIVLVSMRPDNSKRAFYTGNISSFPAIV